MGRCRVLAQGRLVNAAPFPSQPKRRTDSSVAPPPPKKTHRMTCLLCSVKVSDTSSGGDS